MKLRLLALVLLATTTILRAENNNPAIMVAEVTTSTAIAQMQLTEEKRKECGFLPDVEGWLRFEAADNPEFNRSIYSAWVPVSKENNYIGRSVLGREKLKYKGVGVIPLEPNTLYYYRAIYGANPSEVRFSATRTFHTAAGAMSSRPVRIAVLQGLDVRAANFSALITKVAEKNPDYVVFAGNSVMYDRAGSEATTLEAMRAEWQTLLRNPAIRALLSKSAVFWQKNDRDFRFSRADAVMDGEPNADLGIRVFREQLPIVDPEAVGGVNFRSVQISRDLAIWLTESRDYRSPAAEKDDAEKSLWGDFQLEWLERSLKNSRATFRLIISPTPIVGSQSTTASDSHANGYTTERDNFLALGRKSDVLDAGVLAISGGSDALYHTRLNEGLEEIGVGALNATQKKAAAAGLGKGVLQLFHSEKSGFALIEITPPSETAPAKFTATLCGAETGEVLYSVTRSAAK